MPKPLGDKSQNTKQNQVKSATFLFNSSDQGFEDCFLINE